MLVISYYSLKQTRPFCIWLITILWLVALNALKVRGVQDMFDVNVNRLLQTETFLFFSWMILRLTSVTLDICKSADYDNEKYCLENYLGYLFYVPTMLHGPPMVYERYIYMIPLNRYQHVEDFLQRLTCLLKVFLRLIILFFLFEGCMHLIYANAVAMEPEVNRTISSNNDHNFLNDSLCRM